MDPAMDIAMSYAEIDIAETETIRPTGRQAGRLLGRQTETDRCRQRRRQTGTLTDRHVYIDRQTDRAARRGRETEQTDKETGRQTK